MSLAKQFGKKHQCEKQSIFKVTFLAQKCYIFF